jgi:unsaturated rhamnogalacturonyl hydrolase
MKKAFCILLIFLNAAFAASDKQIVKIANKAAEYVLTNPVNAGYPAVCAYYGVLKFSQASSNPKLLDVVKTAYAASPITSMEILHSEDKSVSADKRKSRKTEQIRAGHVDWNVFGILPFELYLQTKDQQYLQIAIDLADDEWVNPRPDGMSAYTRLWVDDMFMVGALQLQAYKATGKEIYLNRCLTQLLGYAKILQQQNGLFQHTDQVPIFWGRGNGWAAAVMAMTLEVVPKENPKRQELMDVYLKMMAALKKYQAKSGLWHQIILDSTSYDETSCTGMFTFAIATGIKNGWLDKSYQIVAEKGWDALTKKIRSGRLTDICVGTGAKPEYNHYMNRPRSTGDLHGQAAFLWAASAMLETCD